MLLESHKIGFSQSKVSIFSGNLVAPFPSMLEEGVLRLFYTVKDVPPPVPYGV